MQKNIENNIKSKASIVYAIVLLAIILVVSFLYSIKCDIKDQKQDIHNSYKTLTLTNDFINDIAQAQNYAGLYITSKNNKHRRQLIKVLDSLSIKSDSLIQIKPEDSTAINEINRLLHIQLSNATELNNLLVQKSPLEELNNKLKTLEPVIKEDSIKKINIRQDTIIQEAPRKSFFKRLKSAFNPKKDSVKVFISQRRDTVMEVSKDSSMIVSVVSDAAQSANTDYIKRIRDIESKISKLINANNNISNQITALVLQIYKNNIISSYHTIEKREQKIGINYFTIIIGSIITLLLIMLFIWQIIRDINKARQMREELEVANKNIKQILESRHKMLLSITHDIKSPLSSISGYTQLLKMNLADEQIENIKPIENSIEHIQSLLSNLLDFSALEQDKLDITYSTFDIKQLADELYSMFKPIQERKGIQFNVFSPSVNINSDQLKIRQIATNLISNAIKYTKEGEVNITFTIENNNLIIDVKDTGVGIPQEKQATLFEPFVRIKENNEYDQGNGFGLYVVKGLVELINGTITFSSIVNKGTSIQCIIPVKIEQATFLSNCEDQLNITIYEDDPYLMNILQIMVTKLGHNVISISEETNLIITDMDMGNITGFDILKQYSHLPIILATGRSDFNKQTALDYGFANFISKPFKIEDIATAINGIISKKETLLDTLSPEDELEIRELINHSIKESIYLLEQSLKEDNFTLAQSVCHKLTPLFKQLNLSTTNVMIMDQHKDNEFEGWQKCVRDILAQPIFS